MALALIEGQATGQCVEQKLLASDGEEIDSFGWSVSISVTPGNEVAIVGAGSRAICIVNLHIHRRRGSWRTHPNRRPSGRRRSLAKASCR
ncbi:MAG: FG-GAP repeat protein [Planctomycetes bacterium]|nr:FG-GAP repeat protein [Planctomycetota bacterium]